MKVIRERLGACDLISWCPLLWNIDRDREKSNVLPLYKLTLPYQHNFFLMQEEKKILTSWSRRTHPLVCFQKTKRGAIRKRSWSHVACVYRCVCLFSPLFFLLGWFYFRIFFLSFPKGSLFRLAKCLFPSVRAKESKQNNFLSFSKRNKNRS